MNCTMPELVNMSVGSLPGTSGLEATTVWPLEAKKSRKVLRMSATEAGRVMEVGGWSEGRTTGEPVENGYFRKMKACFPQGLRCKAKKLEKHSGPRPGSTA